jgi:hypothetical protein
MGKNKKQVKEPTPESSEQVEEVEEGSDSELMGSIGGSEEGEFEMQEQGQPGDEMYGDDDESLEEESEEGSVNQDAAGLDMNIDEAAAASNLL